MSMNRVEGGARPQVFETEATPDTAASSGAEAAAPAARGAPPSGAVAAAKPALSRMDVQRALAERAAAAADVAPVSAEDAAIGALAGKHSKLRAAFDRIEAPAGEAKTYRMDRNVDAFASRWKTLEGAKKSFDTTYFIWEDDIFGKAYLGHMLKKAKEGVRIRGMMDATGDAAGAKGFKATFRGQDYLQELVNVDPKRVEIGIYNPVLKKIDDVGNLSQLVASNHDKLAIADGKIFETGGRNMAAHYYSDPKDHKGVYRDTDIHVESEVAARSATKAFEDEFKNDDVVYRVKPDRFGNWSKKDIELLGAASMMDHWLKAPPLSEAEKDALRAGDKATVEKFAKEAIDHALADLKKQGVTRKPSGRDMDALRKLAGELVSNPELRGSYRTERPKIAGEVKVIDRVSSANAIGKNEIGDALIAIIDGAQESIEIHNPYVVMTERGLDALERAGERGVDIKIITNSPESTDSALTQAFFLEDWPMILARVPNSRILVATGDQKHHAKSFVVDGVLTGVSTYNADWISARVNSEVIALTWSEEFARDTLASYDETIADKAHDFVEYRIKRDPDGKALVKDGKPIIEFGPADHTPKEKLEGMLKHLRGAASWARHELDALEPLRHRPLDPAKDNIRIVE